MADLADILSRYLPDVSWVDYPVKRNRLSEDKFAENPFAEPARNPLAEARVYDPQANRPRDAMAPVAETLSPTMGAYGAGQLLGDTYEKARDADWGGVAANSPFLAAMAAPIPGVKRVPNPIKAYHGSPHDFDKFDLSKIGTGEGAQAYGHGLYFAEAEPVAQSYRDSLVGNKYKGGTPERIAFDALDEASGDRAGAVARLRQEAGGRPDRWTDTFKRAADMIEGGWKPESFGGKMYEVALHATPEQFLDWDKPLKGQSEASQQAFHALRRQADDRILPKSQLYLESEGKLPADTNMGTRLYAMEQALGQQKNVSDILREAGIPGTRYLDAESRAKADAMLKAGKSWPEIDATPGLTRNAVVWTPKIIEILKKYGIAAPVAGASLADILSQPSPTSQ